MVRHDVQQTALVSLCLWVGLSNLLADRRLDLRLERDKLLRWLGHLLHDLRLCATAGHAGREDDRLQRGKPWSSEDARHHRLPLLRHEDARPI